MDETTVGLHPVMRACWMPRGRQKRLDTPGQPQWHHLFGAYNFVTDAIIAMPAPKKNSDSFIAFLDTLVHQWPDDRPALLILDNASYHLSATAQAGLAAFEDQLMPFFLPPYCSDLNPIQRHWRHLKASACAHTLFPSMAQLIASVLANLVHQNDPTNPHPLLYL